ncbi:M23 family metallopeptidase [Siminovitchia fortis]|uniref:M23 family metallopeptidase n=2 Tax=Siminovitchia fortis TaxID=254758 RepID=A0A443IZD4_9BACI|nr:M23 family metallopeptidase [Siminovitchia fortis]RWR13551.1 M23 family metallopeptidase [Siminovitchia fortis]
MMAEVMKMREEEKKRSSLKNFFRKRWVFPAIYLASAALLISTIFWYQTAGKNTADKPNLTEESKELTGMNDDTVVEVNQSLENVSVPVKNEEKVEYITQFFDADAAAEEQEAALIVDGNKYRPNMGVDIAMKDGSEFEVIASLSGKVTAARNDSLLGNVIEVEHENGVKTIYQSVKDMQVKSGDTVKQGQKLATSGTSQFNKEAKNHLHFEIRKDNTALNPLDFFGQPFTAFEKVDNETADTDKQEDASGETEQNPAAGESNQQETEVEKDVQSEETDAEKDNQSQETDTDEDGQSSQMTDE